MSLGLIYDRRFLDHDPGDVHPERPQRLTVILHALRQAGLLERLVPIPFRQAKAEEIATVHDPAYVDLVRMACDEGFTRIGSGDTGLCARSYDVAALAVGGAIAACDAVMAGAVRRAFCAVRPPGHHAEADRALGFCLFNNVAVAAEHLVRNHRLKRVAIVDFDAHHGNGTQQIFQSRPDVLYISIHERPGSLPFPGTGEETEVGSGPGEGYTLNVPLSRGAGEAEYRAALDGRVLPRLHQYRPEFLLVSAGFDALSADTISHLRLEPESYGWLTQLLVEAADRHADGRLVSMLEGGYAVDHLGQAAVSHLLALLASPTSSRKEWQRE
jgi:acetoin utilization deacetylase AcuC-like enzyme